MYLKTRANNETWQSLGLYFVRINYIQQENPKFYQQVFPKGKYFVTRSCGKVCTLGHYLHRLHEISFLSELITLFFLKQYMSVVRRLTYIVYHKHLKVGKVKLMNETPNLLSSSAFQLCHQNGKLVKLLTGMP